MSENDDENAPKQFDKEGPQHDWVVTSVDEEVQYKEEKTPDGRTRRVRTRKTKRRYKEDTGTVTHHSCCVIS
eukprot:CAMPEP_0113638542 /NCGR_PEP_ID=MMETSP0017_2-20120614/20194_1 /TAXON_ID=2856 /ORGANISM="Cylindrotheca closterium" /LENGTH=71 /DNA_ID=CAMNT_0000549661 /DNA_START=228 /DNA_END=443 /DNA_ORIENTATION=+ /assembly_acc=CAM_ASM_000147